MTDRKPSLLQRLLGASRYLIALPVIALFLGAVTLVVLGSIDTARVIAHVISGEMAEKESVLEFITLADTFLLATVLYIIALGLYELFIDDNIVLPAWLVIHDLDDLKEKLVGVVVVVLAVLFLGIVIKTQDYAHLMQSGVGIAAVIGVLSLFLWQLSTHRRAKSRGKSHDSGADQAAGEEGAG